MTYPPRRDANPRAKKRGDGAHHPEHDPGGTGVEIVREVRVCRACSA